MKVYRNGVELQNATVEYGKDNKPAFVTADGVRQHAKHFVIEDEAPKTKKKVVKALAPKKKGLLSKLRKK